MAIIRSGNCSQLKNLELLLLMVSNIFNLSFTDHSWTYIVLQPFIICEFAKILKRYISFSFLAVSEKFFVLVLFIF